MESEVLHEQTCRKFGCLVLKLCEVHGEVSEVACRPALHMQYKPQTLLSTYFHGAGGVSFHTAPQDVVAQDKKRKRDGGRRAPFKLLDHRRSIPFRFCAGFQSESVRAAAAAAQPECTKVE